MIESLPFQDLTRTRVTHLVEETETSSGTLHYSEQMDISIRNDPAITSLSQREKRKLLYIYKQLLGPLTFHKTIIKRG